MNFFKPTKVTISVLLLLLVIFPGELILGFLRFFGIVASLQGMPYILGALFGVLYLTTDPIFFFLLKLGLDVGRFGGFIIPLPQPNVLGWVLLILIDGIIYYVIASAISYKTKGTKVGTVIVWLSYLLALTYLFYFVPYQFITTNPATRAKNVCMQPIVDQNNVCLSNCEKAFDPSYFSSSTIVVPVSAELRSCLQNCQTQFDEATRQCPQ